MTDHFNRLTEAEQERLSILIEECGEVIQAACKILRHGYGSHDPTKAPPNARPESNREALERELGDVAHAMQRMQTANDISFAKINVRANSKPERIKPYLHHQGE